MFLVAGHVNEVEDLMRPPSSPEGDWKGFYFFSYHDNGILKNKLLERVTSCRRSDRSTVQHIAKASTETRRMVKIIKRVIDCIDHYSLQQSLNVEWLQSIAELHGRTEFPKPEGTLTFWEFSKKMPTRAEKQIGDIREAPIAAASLVCLILFLFPDYLVFEAEAE